MTLQATMYGAGSIGASVQTPASDVAFTVPVTVTTGGLAVAVELGMSGAAGAGIFNPAAYLLADNAGTPGQVLALFAGRAGSHLNMSTTSRWLACPVMYWIPAGSYWIGAQSTYSGGTGELKYAAGSSGDGYTIDGSTASVLHEPASTSTTSTATDRAYSLRLVVLSEAIAPITGVLGAIQAGQVFAGTGTVTAPTPPTPPGSGGNRMGGTGAVRKPPR